MSDLEDLLLANATKPAREQLTLIRIFEELRERGYAGGYDTVRRYARRWSKKRGQSVAADVQPLFDRSDRLHAGGGVGRPKRAPLWTTWIKSLSRLQHRGQYCAPIGGAPLQAD